MKTRVEHVMSAPVALIPADGSFKQAVALLCEHEVSAAPVVDDAGRVVGVISEADLLAKAERTLLEARPRLLQSRATRLARAKAAGRRVRDVMTSPAITVSPCTTLEDAARVMQERHLRRLPVVDSGGRLVGVVSRADVLSIFLRTDDRLREEVVDAVRSRLAVDPAGMEVGVRAGVVRMRGVVERRSDVMLIEELVPGLEGVVGLDSSVTYRHDDTVLWPPETGHGGWTPPLW